MTAPSHEKKRNWFPLLVSPSVSDSRIFFESGTESGKLLSTTLQHVVLYISLERAIEVLKGIHFIQGEDLQRATTFKMTHTLLVVLITLN